MKRIELVNRSTRFQKRFVPASNQSILGQKTLRYHTKKETISQLCPTLFCENQSSRYLEKANY